NPEICLLDHAVVDSGCSIYMTGNKAYLSDYEDYNGGFVAFGSDPKGAFEEEIKRAAQATSINKLNTGRPSVSASNSPLVSTAIDASTLPNADLPIDPNMPNLEDDSNVFPNDGIFSGAYDDEDVGAEADFNNMDNTIDVSPIPTFRVHRDHPKGQILEDPYLIIKKGEEDYREMITSQLQGKLWLYDKVRTRLCLFCHHQIGQLEVHGAPISKEDINQKFLRSLPPSWNQIALIMRNKPDIDEIDIDDLYNNLRVYEDEMKRSSSSTSTSQNLAFLSSENTSSTNEVSTASGDFEG
ncbi:hypothetical protein Tco_1334601, partial [Tanacetum coccineum]